MRLLWVKLQKKYKLLVAAFLIVGVSGGATIGVMAAIPHSTTGVISACRSNSNGNLQVIDAEIGATCGNGQTALSWPSTQVQTAVARIKENPIAEEMGILDTVSSRNITAFQGSTANASFCIKVPFTPRAAILDTRLIQNGGSENAILGVGGTTQAGIDNACGPGGYNVIITAGGLFNAATFIYITE